MLHTELHYINGIMLHNTNENILINGIMLHLNLLLRKIIHQTEPKANRLAIYGHHLYLFMVDLCQIRTGPMDHF